MKNLDYITQQKTDMLVSSKKYHQLLAISELTARQMFGQNDYINLAQSLIANDKDNLSQESIDKLNNCIHNFQNFMLTNNHLQQLLVEVGTLVDDTKVPKVEQEVVEVNKEIKKPSFTVTK